MRIGKRVVGTGLAICLMATSAQAGQSAAERAMEVLPGPWQGNWLVTRDDPRIRTNAGAELARLHIIQDKGQQSLEVQWVSGRAMCEDPNQPPCEWASASGTATRAKETRLGGMTAVLAVSADQDDPFTLQLVRRPKSQEAVAGTLRSARGDIIYKVWLQRADH